MGDFRCAKSNLIASAHAYTLGDQWFVAGFGGDVGMCPYGSRLADTDGRFAE